MRCWFSFFRAFAHAGRLDLGGISHMTLISVIDILYSDLDLRRVASSGSTASHFRLSEILISKGFNKWPAYMDRGRSATVQSNVSGRSQVYSSATVWYRDVNLPAVASAGHPKQEPLHAEILWKRDRGRLLWYERFSSRLYAGRFGI